MIAKELKTVGETLDKLIAITELDLTDIKAAKHNEIFSRVQTKDKLVSLFEAQKGSLDRAISAVMSRSPNADLLSVIGQEERDLLERLKNSLIALHKLNKRFASMSLTIGEFYSSLLSAILPSEQSGYDGAKLSTASFLRVRG
ncbi:MAG: hypothetical protein LBI57_05650 [Helicobacteraceae bacterium]|jgi:hypothetical protein|nr:hypothetical protein [Helicobacteraceae bacterium]